MLSLICNRASICKQSVKALMGISAEFYYDKIDINFIDVNAKSLWPFSTFVNQVLKFYSHFACSERLRKFPIKYGDLCICGRGVRKLPVQYWHRNHCCIWFSSLICVAHKPCSKETAPDRVLDKRWDWMLKTIITIRNGPKGWCNSNKITPLSRCGLIRLIHPQKYLS